VKEERRVGIQKMIPTFAVAANFFFIFAVAATLLQDLQIFFLFLQWLQKWVITF